MSASTYKSKYQCYSRFFIIKSFTEEDVHKAIKYNVWSSTHTGNQILDEAFHDLSKIKNMTPDIAPEISTDIIDDTVPATPSTPEIYLMFSVNKSKHFCGVAKMIDRVRTDIQHD